MYREVIDRRWSLLLPLPLNLTSPSDPCVFWSQSFWMRLAVWITTRIPSLYASSIILLQGKETSWTHTTRKMWYCIAGKFWGRKLWRISQFCGYPRMFSLPNLGAWYPLARHEWSIRKSFVRKNRIFRQFAKIFSLKSFQLYSSSTFCSPVMCAKHYLQLSLWTKFHVLINTMEYQAHYYVKGTHSPIPSHLSLIPFLPPFLPPSSLPFILYLSIPPTSLLPPSNISAPIL